MTIAKDLLEILACPGCRKSLEEADDFLICAACCLKFPIREGIPVLLLDEAVALPSSADEKGSDLVR